MAPTALVATFWTGKGAMESVGTWKWVTEVELVVKMENVTSEIPSLSLIHLYLLRSSYWSINERHDKFFAEQWSNKNAFQ